MKRNKLGNKSWPKSSILKESALSISQVSKVASSNTAHMNFISRITSRTSKLAHLHGSHMLPLHRTRLPLNLRPLCCSLSPQFQYNRPTTRNFSSSDPPTTSGSSVPYPDVPGASKGGKKLAIVYTCTVCDTRAAKRFTENAYLNGVVMVRCPGCQNLHLIADRLGFFEDKEGGGWDVEKFMKEKGEDVMAVNEGNVLELTMADVLGGKRGTDGDENEGNEGGEGYKDKKE